MALDQQIYIFRYKDDNFIVIHTIITFLLHDHCHFFKLYG